MIKLASDLLQYFILPPGINLLLALLGYLLLYHWPRFSKLLIATGLISLYVFSTGNGAYWLMAPLEDYPALNITELASPKPAAIVVLSATNVKAPEYQEITSDNIGLARASYAAKLYQQTRLPILLAGGDDQANEMKTVLEQRYNIPVKWLDDKSEDTYQNAQQASELLDLKSNKRIYLVTSAWHMSRAMWSFKHFGFDPVAAPTDYQLSPGHNSIMGLLPSARALYLSSLALHEYIGLLWYWIRY